MLLVDKMEQLGSQACTCGHPARDHAIYPWSEEVDEGITRNGCCRCACRMQVDITAKLVAVMEVLQ